MKLNNFLNIIMGSCTGVFLGHSIYIYWDYNKHPELYATNSAPWYTSVLIYGLLAIVAIAIGFTIKWFMRRNKA